MGRRVCRARPTIGPSGRAGPAGGGRPTTASGIRRRRLRRLRRTVTTPADPHRRWPAVTTGPPDRRFRTTATTRADPDRRWRRCKRPPAAGRQLPTRRRPVAPAPGPQPRRNAAASHRQQNPTATPGPQAPGNPAVAGRGLQSPAAPGPRNPAASHRQQDRAAPGRQARRNPATAHRQQGPAAGRGLRIPVVAGRGARSPVAGRGGLIRGRAAGTIP
jgi:hypothetical protein